MPSIFRQLPQLATQQPPAHEPVHAEAAKMPSAASMGPAVATQLRLGPQIMGDVLQGHKSSLGFIGSVLEPAFLGSVNHNAVSSKVGRADDNGMVAAKRFSPHFRTQADAANFIADQITGTYNSPEVDKRVRNAIRDACNQWRPGDDLAKLVYDAIKVALEDVLPHKQDQAPSSPFPVDIPGMPQLPPEVTQVGGPDMPITNPFVQQNQFAFPDTIEYVASLMAARIAGTGSTVGQVAERMMTSGPDMPR
jgi:hypothetical protein